MAFQCNASIFLPFPILGTYLSPFKITTANNSRDGIYLSFIREGRVGRGKQYSLFVAFILPGNTQAHTPNWKMWLLKRSVECAEMSSKEACGSETPMMNRLTMLFTMGNFKNWKLTKILRQ